jgi:hypothetical protein
MNKEMFPVYNGKRLSRKAAHSWVEKFSQGRYKVADDDTEVRKWLKQQAEDDYAAVFDSLLTRWDKCINVGGRYVEK